MPTYHIIAGTLDPGWDVRQVRASKSVTPDVVQELSDLLGGEDAVVKASKRSGLAPQTRIAWR